MRTLLVILAIIISSTCYADTWDGEDKKLHAVAGMFSGFFGYAASDIYNEESDEMNKVVFGTALSFSIGLSKELYDMNHPGNHFCWKDLAVTTAGGLVGSALGTSVTYIDSTVSVSRTWKW
jgi:uncharacterized protein YfiM (DUF2279 family)